LTSALSGCNANVVVRCGRLILDQVAGCRELGGAVRANATTNKYNKRSAQFPLPGDRQCFVGMLFSKPKFRRVSMNWGIVIFIGIMLVLLMIGLFVKVRR